MDERHELFQGLRVTATPGLEQAGHIGGQLATILSLSPPGGRSKSLVALQDR